ncbi:MAG: helix-turn-helix transcriptional regulator [Candidatus Levyibacteriota bacterium]
MSKSTVLRKSFGERIRALRKLVEISQEELGFRTGLDRTYISGIERGERNPALDNIGKLAKELKVSLKELFSF